MRLTHFYPRTTFRSFTAALLGLAATFSAGCDSTGPTTGAIAITVSTVGPNIDLDTDGYTFSIDGGQGQAIGVNSTVTIANLPTGSHLVRLDGLAPNCSVSGTNPVSVDVIAGDNAASPLSVLFSVSCIPRTGSIRVSAATSGTDLDPNGYSVSVGAVVKGDLVTNGVLEIAGIREGQTPVWLSGVSENCAVDGANPSTVNVAFGATVEVAFSIRCVAAGSLRVTSATTGVDLDANGYDLVVRLQPSSVSTQVSVPPNGTTTVSGLLPGNYLLTLFGVVPNCDAITPSPRIIAVGAGSATLVSVDVKCVAPTLLAFVKGSGASAEIYVVKSNGADETRLTFQLGSDVNPAWSPDGSMIAFASERDGNREIYVMNASGQSPVRLTTVAASDYRPAWSPDGSRIAFVSERDGNADIYVMNADGANQVRLTSHNASDGDPPGRPMEAE